jgi:hypothetical protein
MAVVVRPDDGRSGARQALSMTDVKAQHDPGDQPDEEPEKDEAERAGS